MPDTIGRRSVLHVRSRLGDGEVGRLIVGGRSVGGVLHRLLLAGVGVGNEGGVLERNL